MRLPVCNFLELFARTLDGIFCLTATALIDQVHQVLGRFRYDDSRTGWISGLDEKGDAVTPLWAASESASL
jgi:hypothetical protein